MANNDAFKNLPDLFRQLSAGFNRTEDRPTAKPILIASKIIELAATDTKHPPVLSKPRELTPELDLDASAAKECLEEDASSVSDKHGLETKRVRLDDVEEGTVTAKPRRYQYVLILIDANSHMFSERFLQKLKGNPLGASDIKSQFYLAVKNYFSQMDLHLGRTCRIVVRAFTDLTAATNNSFLYFAAIFSSADPFFDFVIVQNGEIIENKIVEAFEAAIKDRSCKHVFVAAWRRPLYLSMLNMSNKSMNDKIAIIEGSSMRKGFDALSFPVPFTTFPHIFKGPDDSEYTTTSTQAETMTDGFSFADPLRSIVAEPATNLDTANCKDSTHPIGIVSGQGEVEGILPTPKNARVGCIPINRENERLNS